MARTATIFHVHLLIPREQQKGLLAALHEQGICELKEGTADLQEEPIASHALADAEARLNLVRKKLEPYKKVVQPEARLRSLFRPKKEEMHKVYASSAEAIVGEAERCLMQIEPKVARLLDGIAEEEEKIKENEEAIANLSLLPDIDTSVFSPTRMLSVMVGKDRNESLAAIRDRLGEVAVYGVSPAGEDQSFVAIFCYQENKAEVAQLLHETGFEMISLPSDTKKPGALLKDRRKLAQELAERIRKDKEMLTKVANFYAAKLDVLAEEVAIARQKEEAVRFFRSGHAFSALEAWVPEKQIEKFRKEVEAITPQFVLSADIEDEAPTLYQNHRFIAPFEVVTNLYSPPKHRRFDPTIILAISFSLFFGLMLTDFVYGVVLFTLGQVMYRIGKDDKAMRNTGTILTAFGITTAMWGVVYGSYFGDFFEKIGIHIPYLLNSLTDVMPSLGVAIVLGTLHMGSGLIVGFIENTKMGKFMDACSRQGVWIVFIIGVAVLIAGAKAAGLGLIGLAVVMQVVFAFIEGGPVTSLLSVFNFSGFMGDLFSYARLMALAVGTAGIALAVNFMTMLAKDLIPVVGIVIGIFIFIAGHVFNLAMNGLGAFIHSTRLHFLEFFQKFYDGGGKLYSPFKAERKKTYLGG